MRRNGTPIRIRIPIVSSTGKWIATNQAGESFRSRARQAPNGQFMTQMRGASRVGRELPEPGPPGPEWQVHDEDEESDPSGSREIVHRISDHSRAQSSDEEL